MPTTTTLALSFTSGMAKSNTILTSDPSVDTSVTSFSTGSDGLIPQDDLVLLSRLQGIPVHAPPGARPTRTGSRAPTKTELAASRKMLKESKQKAADDKKLATAARKAANLAKKQERLISSTKAKASKATAKAEELRLKLAEVTIAGGPSASPLADTSHSHKKRKETTDTSSVISSPAPSFLQSPQRKTFTANKRVSVHSPSRFSP
jgi:hypothetical protein